MLPWWWAGAWVAGVTDDHLVAGVAGGAGGAGVAGVTDDHLVDGVDGADGVDGVAGVSGMSEPAGVAGVTEMIESVECGRFMYQINNSTTTIATATATTVYAWVSDDIGITARNVAGCEPGH